MSTFDQYQLGTDLKNPFLKSAILHGCLVLIAFILQIDFISQFLTRNLTTAEVKELKSAVRVDVVGMPKFTIQELKNMEIDSKPQDEAGNDQAAQKVEENPSEGVQELGQSKLNDILKNLSQKKVGTVAKSQGKGLQGVNQNQLKNLILEGNQISTGTAAIGDSSGEELTEFEQYVMSLPNHVRRFWKLPSYLMDKELKCRIRIFISAQGAVIRSVIYESSGVEEFDQRAVMSIQSANPFPMPNANIAKRLVGGEVILGFPL
jgi:colicin import membrane protein